VSTERKWEYDEKPKVQGKKKHARRVMKRASEDDKWGVVGSKKKVQKNQKTKMGGGKKKTNIGVLKRRGVFGKGNFGHTGVGGGGRVRGV